MNIICRIAFYANSGYLPVKKADNDPDSLATVFEGEDSVLRTVMEVAASEVNVYQLYVPKPYDAAEDVRSFPDSYIQNAAQDAHDAAAARIGNGEDREAVFSEYLSDGAFDAWYEEFVSEIQAAADV